MDIFINWATVDCSICTLCNGVISVLVSHSVLRYLSLFGFSALMDYLHALVVSDVVKLFIRKIIIIIIIIITILGTARILRKVLM